jgi:hypothetical protein
MDIALIVLQTEIRSKLMTPLLSYLARYLGRFEGRKPRPAQRPWAGHARKPRRRPLTVESLEDRTVPTAVAVPSGLVSWWTANNTPNDVMGLNNATLTNVTYAAGEVGQAFNFNGSNGWAALGDPSSLAFTTSFTIEGWIKVNGLPTNYNFGSILFRGDDRGGLDPYQLVIKPNGNLQFGISSTTTGASLEAPIPTGQYVHVAATLDDGTGAMTLYENGAVVAQSTTTVRPFGPLDPTQQPGVGIGNSNALSNYDVPFNGLIDELSVYNRALTAGEVLGIAKAGSSGKVSSPIAINNPSVVEGAAGTTAPVTFTVQRTGSLSGSLSVNWTTADDSATSANADYVAASGTLLFADGEATKTVQVTVNGDNTVEPTESFELLVTPAGGTAVMGLATIVTDDVSISINDVTITEGDAAIRFLDNFVSEGSGGLSGPKQILFGPDVNGDSKPDLFVPSRSANQVLKYDGVTGTYLGTVIDNDPRLNGPWAMTLGPDGNLYVGGVLSHNVLRYTFATGVVDEFIPAGASGLVQVKGLNFGPDGNLYVSNSNGGGGVPGPHQVLRLQGPFGASPVAPLPAPGQSGAVFVADGSGGLSNPHASTFGPDGNLYVANAFGDNVLRYDGTTGAFLGTFVAAGSGGLDLPNFLAFRPDGYLYVVSQNTNALLRYNASTGAFVDAVIPSTSGLSGPTGLAFDAVGNLYLSSADRVVRFGPASQAAFTISLSSANVLPVTVNYATGSVGDTAVAGSDYTAASGTVTFAPGETTKTVLVQTRDDSVIELPETFTVTLSSPVVGTLADGTGVGTIRDNDTKFYVVDDGSGDKTFEYGTTGLAGENYALTGGNTAPRGAATTAAGTTVWVVDANKTVYVYNASGSLLGSWTAGGMQGNPQLEGIATNGTDIWLLDNSKDKVYKYTGAASRLSGSQNAASSFSLNSANSNGKDLVTDGTSFWVVNDSTTDKVFKYTLSGTLLGSWTIDPANASPTGITLNPANVSDLWIVDNGTDKIYQYTGAASRTSGSQNAAATYALAPGNTNPQGVADPPDSTGAPAPASSTQPVARLSPSLSLLTGSDELYLPDQPPDVDDGLSDGFAGAGAAEQALAAGTRRVPGPGCDDRAVLADQVFADWPNAFEQPLATDLVQVLLSLDRERGRASRG